MVLVLSFLGGGVCACVFGLLVGAVRRVKGGALPGGVMEGVVRGVSRVAHVYKVVVAVASACMVYRSSCWGWVRRTFGAVTSYTWVVSGRWRLKVILAVVCRTM